MRWRYLHILILIISGAAVYSNTLYSPFIFDDEFYLLDNPSIRTLKTALSAPGTRYAAYLSFALNYYLGGYNVFGYHLTNIVIHISNGILVYVLMVLTLRTPLLLPAFSDEKRTRVLAFFTALIFIVHPVQTQAVTYVSQRFASMATLFYLLSAILYIKARQSGQPSRLRFVFCYSVSLLGALLAMMTKEIGFTLPFVLALYEFTFLKREKGSGISLLLPFFIAATAVPLMIFGVLGGETGLTEKTRLFQIGLFEKLWGGANDYLITQFSVIVTYLRLLVFPVNQNLVYDYPLYSSFFSPRVFVSFVFLSTILLATFFFYLRQIRQAHGPGLLVCFGVFWFFITLSVESSVIPLRYVIFEHRVYLPSVGIIAAFTTSIFWGAQRLKTKRINSASIVVWGILPLMAATLAVASYFRNEVWRDPLIMWADVVKKSPQRAEPHHNLGIELSKLKRYDAAIRAYEKAIQLDPSNPRFHTSMGITLSEMGSPAEAFRHFQEALRLNPDDEKVRLNLANLLAVSGRLEDALYHYKEALRLRPNYSKAHKNLGRVLEYMGRIEEAKTHYAEAVELDPQDLETRKWLKTLLAH